MTQFKKKGEKKTTYRNESLMSLELKNKHSVKILIRLSLFWFQVFFLFLLRRCFVLCTRLLLRQEKIANSNQNYSQFFFVSTHLSSWKQVHLLNNYGVCVCVCVCDTTYFNLNKSEAKKKKNKNHSNSDCSLFFILTIFGFYFFHNRRYASNNDERNQTGKTIFA